MRERVQVMRGDCVCCRASEDDVREVRLATGDDGLCDACREHCRRDAQGGGW